MSACLDESADREASQISQLIGHVVSTWGQVRLRILGAQSNSPGNVKKIYKKIIFAIFLLVFFYLKRTCITNWVFVFDSICFYLL
jgi:hypothetical protein